MSTHTLTRSRRVVGAALVLAAACLAPEAAARAEESAELQRKVQDLESRIAAMEAAIRALQAQKGAPGAADAAELQRRLDILAAELEKMRLGQAASEKPLEPVHGLGPAASRVYGAARGVSLGGYGEALYENFSATDDGNAPSGKLDRFDFLRGVLYAGYKFSDRIVFNSEIEFEHGSTERGGAVSVEFAYLDFLLSPRASIRAGMVLVPAGFINEMHEPPIFLGARRPEVERRVIPATWNENGVGVFGGAGPLSYRAYLLTGFKSAGFTGEEALRDGRQGGAEATAENFAVAARLDYTGVPGLLVGAFAYQGDSSQGARAPVGFSVDPNGNPVTPPTAPFDATVRLYDLHAGYRGRGLDLRALYALGHLDDAKQVNDANGLDGAASVGERFEGWYLQAGYDLLSRRRSAQVVMPFVRCEAFNTQDEVPDEAPQAQDPNVTPAPFAADKGNDVRVWTYGVVYKPISNVGIKIDYQDYKNEVRTGVDQISLALGYLF